MHPVCVCNLEHKHLLMSVSHSLNVSPHLSQEKQRTASCEPFSCSTSRPHTHTQSPCAHTHILSLKTLHFSLLSHGLPKR